MVGLLGPNGSGKTTLLSALATMGVITSGSIRVGGHDLSTPDGRRDARKLVGWLPQRFDLASTMTVIDAVRYAAWANGVPAAESRSAAERALAVVDLTGRAYDRVRRLSGGQRQRVGLAASVAHDPRVVLLDEPTVGLDPEQRVRFRSYLRAAGTGRTTIMATHLLEDVRQTCDRLVVLLHGRVAFDGLSADLAARGEGIDDPLESPFERGYRLLLEQAQATPNQVRGSDHRPGPSNSPDTDDPPRGEP